MFLQMGINYSPLPGFGNYCPILEDLGTLTAANCKMYVVYSIVCLLKTKEISK